MVEYLNMLYTLWDVFKKTSLYYVCSIEESYIQDFAIITTRHQGLIQLHSLDIWHKMFLCAWNVYFNIDKSVADLLCDCVLDCIHRFYQWRQYFLNGWMRATWMCFMLSRRQYGWKSRIYLIKQNVFLEIHFLNILVVNDWGCTDSDNHNI